MGGMNIMKLMMILHMICLFGDNCDDCNDDTVSIPAASHSAFIHLTNSLDWSSVYLQWQHLIFCIYTTYDTTCLVSFHINSNPSSLVSPPCSNVRLFAQLLQVTSQALLVHLKTFCALFQLSYSYLHIYSVIISSPPIN